jgi:multiple sugar transport system ATP-binding protein
MTMADRIVVMNAGRIEQIGTPLELYDTPATLFVADFIGSPSMNVLKGTLRGGAVALENGSSIPVQAAGEGKPVLLGIRPEHAEIVEGGGVPLTVEVVEPTGASIQVYARLGESLFCIVFSERRELRPGDEIHARFPPDRIHLFDPDTGRRF